MASDWIQHFGLREDPFAEAGDDELFYSSPQLSQRLNLLLHLAQYSDLLLVVTGARGSGKTTLIRRLLADAGPRWRASLVEAEAETDPAELIGQVIAGFELPSRAAQGGDRRAVLEAFLHGLRKGSTRPVVVVDEAHLLPPGSLEELGQLAADRDRLGLAVLLFGEPQLLERIGRLTGSGVVHVIDIPALTEAQVAEYLELRLAHAGHRGRSPFNAEAVRLVCKTARGLPGLVNPAAARFLANRAAGGGGILGVVRRFSRRVTRRGLAIGAGTVLLAAALGVGAWLVGTAGAPPPATTVALPLPKVETVPVERPPPRSVQPPARPPVTPPTVASGLGAPPEPRPTPPAPAARPTPPAPEPPAPAPVRAPSRPEPPAVVRADETWLLGQQAENHTVQLFGSFDAQAAERFKQQQRLKDRLAIYRTRRDGREWYVVVMGSYGSRDAARKAIQGLPNEVKRWNPWPKSLGSVQESIRGTGERTPQSGP